MDNTNPVKTLEHIADLDMQYARELDARFVPDTKIGDIYIRYRATNYFLTSHRGAHTTKHGLMTAAECKAFLVNSYSTPDDKD